MTYHRDKSPTSPSLDIRQQIPPIQHLQHQTNDSSTSGVLLGCRCYCLQDARQGDVSCGRASQHTGAYHGIPDVYYAERMV